MGLRLTVFCLLVVIVVSLAGYWLVNESHRYSNCGAVPSGIGSLQVHNVPCARAGVLLDTVLIDVENSDRNHWLIDDWDCNVMSVQDKPGQQVVVACEKGSSALRLVTSSTEYYS